MILEVQNDKFEESWNNWFQDNKDRFPEDKLEFIKTVYKDGFIDGKNSAEHTVLMQKLDELSNKIK